MAAMVMDVTAMADMAMENPVMVTATEKRMNKDITKASEEFVNDAPLVSVVIPVYNVSHDNMTNIRK